MRGLVQVIQKWSASSPFDFWSRPLHCWLHRPKNALLLFRSPASLCLGEACYNIVMGQNTFSPSMAFSHKQMFAWFQQSQWWLHCVYSWQSRCAGSLEAWYSCLASIDTEALMEVGWGARWLLSLIVFLSRGCIYRKCCTITTYDHMIKFGFFWHWYIFSGDAW